MEMEQRMAAHYWGYIYPDYKALPGVPMWRTMDQHDDQSTLLVAYRAINKMNNLGMNS